MVSCDSAIVADTVSLLLISMLLLIFVSACVVNVKTAFDGKVN